MLKSQALEWNPGATVLNNQHAVVTCCSFSSFCSFSTTFCQWAGNVFCHAKQAFCIMMFRNQEADEVRPYLYDRIVFQWPSVIVVQVCTWDSKRTGWKAWNGLWEREVKCRFSKSCWWISDSGKAEGVAFRTKTYSFTLVFHQDDHLRYHSVVVLVASHKHSRLVDRNLSVKRLSQSPDAFFQLNQQNKA